MARLQVTCINKTDCKDAHQRLRSIGGHGWKFTESVAIGYIELGEHTFYVDAGPWMLRVIIGTSPSGTKYLKTESDDEQPDTLLNLPECK